MAGKHYGITYQKPSGKPRIKVLTGHFGISFSVSGLKPVSVRDSNGRPLKGVTVIANNAVAGVHTSLTDPFGGTSIYVEDNTEVLFIKDDFTFAYFFTSGKKISITIDLPIIPN